MGCVVCDKDLVGIQRKFCGTRCHDKYWNASVRKKTWKSKTPRKMRAIWAVDNAVRAGTIQRANQCSICKTLPMFGRLVAHHQNYNEPLIVDWLCDLCHKRVHLTVSAVIGVARCG